MSYLLLKNFYSETASTYSLENSASFNCIIELDPDHEMYKGHFPQMPVVPGVCLIQIVKEILMLKFQKELILAQGTNIKFLLLINPQKTKIFRIDFTVKQVDDMFEVNANFVNNDITFTKFKGKFKTVRDFFNE